MMNYSLRTKTYRILRKAFEFQVKHLLKMLSLLNNEYYENNYLDLKDDAMLWLHLSRLQDFVDIYDETNETEETTRHILQWANDTNTATEIPEENTSYSLLNPVKLKFINSKDGDKFFSNISNLISTEIGELKSFIQFRLIIDADERIASFPNGLDIKVPFSANDLLQIFKKMGFNASAKMLPSKNPNITVLKLKF